MSASLDVHPRLRDASLAATHLRYNSPDSKVLSESRRHGTSRRYAVRTRAAGHARRTGNQGERLPGQGNGWTRLIVTSLLLSPSPSFRPSLSNLPTSKSLSFATTTVDASRMASPSSLSGTFGRSDRSMASVLASGKIPSGGRSLTDSRDGRI